MTTRRNGQPTTVQELIGNLFMAAVEPRDGGLVSQVETTVTQLLRASPARVAVAVYNLGANPVYLWHDNAVSTSRGIRLGATGGHAILLYDEDFTLPAYAWYAIADGGASAIAIQEILLGGGGQRVL